MKTNKYLQDYEKQSMPLDGEVSPEDAFHKVNLFVREEQSKLNAERQKNRKTRQE